MRLSTAIAALLYLAACAAQQEAPWQEITTTDAGAPASLVGRWKSDTVPTGYWIIDRHADGRYASKYYLCHDLGKPHEIALEWGRWELNGVHYRHIIEGTNSEVLQPFIGRWREWPVINQTHDRFAFTVNDSTRHEHRVSITTDLPYLKLPLPKDSLRDKHGIHEPRLENIPDWVFAKPF